MEIIANIVWIMTGFISTLVAMDVAWRIATEQAKREKITSGSKSVVMEHAGAQ